MNLLKLPISWVDLLTVALLVTGLARGRTRGMSAELLDTFQWLAILLTAMFAYETLGQLLAQYSPFGQLSCFVGAYALIIIFYKSIAAFIRHRTGEKVVSGDSFGRGEFYLGMLAGTVRYACVMLVVMAFLNARHYTNEELQEIAEFQESNFGDIRFPTLSGLQAEVFQRSLTGRWTRAYLSACLIRPTPPDSPGLGRSSAVRAREQSVNEMLDRR